MKQHRNRLILLIFLAHPVAARAERLWGVRGGMLAANGTLNKYFYTPVPTLEGFVDLPLKDKLSLELAVGGWTRGSAEQGRVTNGTTGVVTTYHYEQHLSVIPLLATLETGAYKEKYTLRFGAGLGLYVVKLDRDLSFDDQPTQAAFGQSQGKTSLTAGPHMQVSADFHLGKRVTATVFMRYAYAQFNESLSRFFLGANGLNAHFAESNRVGNVAGFLGGYGLAVRL